MTSRFIDPIPQYCDDAGEPLAGGKLYFYDSGTTNLRDTYADSGLVTANANPVILDGAGRPPSIFLQGNYKMILTDANDVQISERDPVSSSGSSAEYSDWSILTSYSINNIVRASDDEYYVSITNNNLGNDPTTTATDWSLIVGIVDWNTNETYSLNDTVRRNGILYRSTANNNQGSDPVSLADWASLSPASAADAVVTISGTNTTVASNGNGDVSLRANGVDVARADADGNLYATNDVFVNGSESLSAKLNNPILANATSVWSGSAYNVAPGAITGGLIAGTYIVQTDLGSGYMNVIHIPDPTKNTSAMVFSTAVISLFSMYHILVEPTGFSTQLLQVNASAGTTTNNASALSIQQIWRL